MPQFACPHLEDAAAASAAASAVHGSAAGAGPRAVRPPARAAAAPAISRRAARLGSALTSRICCIQPSPTCTSTLSRSLPNNKQEGRRAWLSCNLKDGPGLRLSARWSSRQCRDGNGSWPQQQGPSPPPAHTPHTPPPAHLSRSSLLRAELSCSGSDSSASFLQQCARMGDAGVGTCRQRCARAECSTAAYGRPRVVGVGWQRCVQPPTFGCLHTAPRLLAQRCRATPFAA